MLAKFSGVESETSVFKFRKRKRKFLCWHVFTYSIKQAKLGSFVSQSCNDGYEMYKKA